MEEVNAKWDQVSQNLVKDPHNFYLWQQLVKAAEVKSLSKSSKKSDIELLRVSYTSFLNKYPLCVQYWIDYAEWESRTTSNEACEKVYRDSLRQNEYSVELWTSYLQFKVDTISDNILEVLHEFEVARAKIGYHFFADQFYLNYLKFLDYYSGFDDDKLGFKKKYFILLRIIVEIPMYNYKVFHQLLFKILSSLTFEAASYLIPSEDLTALKKSHNNNLKSIAVQIKNYFTLVFITTQYRTYQLFKFEKSFKKPYFDTSYVSKQEIANWDNYLTFLELNDFPTSMVVLTYERCLMSTGLYDHFWLRYSAFWVNKQGFDTSRAILYKGVKIVSNNHNILIEIANLEMHQGNYLKAKDLVEVFVENSTEVPLSVYEKLLNLVHATQKDDSEFMAQVQKLIDKTGNSWFFKVLTNYSFSDFESLLGVFQHFLTTPQAKSALFWSSLVSLTLKYDLQVQFKSTFSASLTPQMRESIIETMPLGRLVLKRLLDEGIDFQSTYTSSLEKFA